MTLTLAAPRKHLIWTTVITLMTVFCGVCIALLPVSDLIALCGIIVISLLFSMTPLTALMFATVLAPMRTLIATEAGFTFPLDIGQILIIALIGSWAVRRIVTRRSLLSLNWSPVYIPIIAFVAVGGLSGFTAWANGAWLTEWLKWVLALLVAALVVEMCRHNRWQWIVLALILAGTANALVGLYIFVGGSGADHLLISNRFFRAFGTFGQPNPFGGFMGLIAPLALGSAWGYTIITWGYWRDQRTFDRNSLLLAGLYSVCGILMSGALIASWSRGAWLSFAASVIVLGIALPRKRWQSALIGAGIVTASLTAWCLGFVPTSVVDRVNTVTQEVFAFNDVRAVDITSENFAVVERLAHWQAALNMATDYPWLGVGLGNYEIAYDSYRLLNWTEPLGHAHNYYLNILAEGGIIGAIVYIVMWAGILRFTLRARKNPDPVLHAVSAGLLATWSYLLIHSLTDNLYVNNIFLHIGIMLGLLAMIERQTWHYQRMESLV